MKRLSLALAVALALALGAFSIDGLAPSNARAYFSDPGGGGGGYFCGYVNGNYQCYWKTP